MTKTQKQIIDEVLKDNWDKMADEDFSEEDFDNYLDNKIKELEKET